jgi:hypothetical protein
LDVLVGSTKNLIGLLKLMPANPSVLGNKASNILLFHLHTCRPYNNLTLEFVDTVTGLQFEFYREYYARIWRDSRCDHVFFMLRSSGTMRLFGFLNALGANDIYRRQVLVAFRYLNCITNWLQLSAHCNAAITNIKMHQGQGALEKTTKESATIHINALVIGKRNVGQDTCWSEW